MPSRSPFAGLKPVRSTVWPVTRRTPLAAPGLHIGTPLAATYSFADGKMYVLDAVNDAHQRPAARLLQIDWAPGGVRVLGTWDRSGRYDRHWLTLDRDGSALLTSHPASARGDERIARLAFAGPAASAGPAKPGSHGGASPALVCTRGVETVSASLLAPFVTPGGYQLIVQHGQELRLDSLPSIGGRRDGHGEHEGHDRDDGPCDGSDLGAMF